MNAVTNKNMNMKKNIRREFLAQVKKKRNISFQSSVTVRHISENHCREDKKNDTKKYIYKTHLTFNTQ